MSSSVVKTCLNLMRRMPPSDVADNLDRLISLRPEAEDELLQRVDLPLEVGKDTKTGKHFIQCDYNRDGDSYRSPWSNEYFPKIDDDEKAFQPEDKLRKIEIRANKLFDVYRHLYFEGGVSSVYLWNLEREGFAACFLIKKDVKPDDVKFPGMTGTWNSIHVFSVTSRGYGSAEPYTYNLTSTVIVSMVVKRKGMGTIDISGSVYSQKTTEQIMDPEEGHLATMGAMIEHMEGNLRNQVEGIYMQKTKEIVNGIRLNDPFAKSRAQQFASLGAAAASKRNKNSS